MCKADAIMLISTRQRAEAQSWIEYVLAGLHPLVAERLRQELTAHYEDAFHHLIESGHWPVDAHEIALESLGNKRLERLRYRMRYPLIFDCATLAATENLSSGISIYNLFWLFGMSDGYRIINGISVSSYLLFVVLALFYPSLQEHKSTDRILSNWRIQITGGLALLGAIWAIDLNSLCIFYITWWLCMFLAMQLPAFRIDGKRRLLLWYVTAVLGLALVLTTYLMNWTTHNQLIELDEIIFGLAFSFLLFAGQPFLTIYKFEKFKHWLLLQGKGA